MMSMHLLPEVKDWSEWASIFIDRYLWRPIVERVLAADEGLRFASGISNPSTIECGYPGTCAVFIVDATAVIKFFPPMVARDFARELAVYQLITPHIPHIPKLLGCGVFKDRISWPYLVVSRITGEAWRDLRPTLPRSDALAVMRTLGGVIRSTHDIRLSQSGAWPASGDWADLVESRLHGVGQDLSAGTALPSEVIAKIEREMAATDWFSTRACLVHADLTEDHLLLDRRDGGWEMNGLIDWADAEVADPIYDLVTFWFSICRRDAVLFGAFMTGYGEMEGREKGWIPTLAAFTFFHRFAANILNEVLSPSEQQSIQSLAELHSLLFGGLEGLSF